MDRTVSAGRTAVARVFRKIPMWTKSPSAIAALLVAGVLASPGAGLAASEVYELPPTPGDLTLQEAPSLAKRVSAGELPSLAERLPEMPFVTEAGEKRSVAPGMPFAPKTPCHHYPM